MLPRSAPSSRSRGWLRLLAVQLGDVVLYPTIGAGLLVVAVLTIHDVRMLAPVILGGAAAALSSAAVGRLPGTRNSGAYGSYGAYGYCGALVGAAAYLDFTSGPLMLAVAAGGGLLCGPLGTGIALALRAGRMRTVRLPVLTAPFCLISGVITVISARRAPQPTAAVQSPSGMPLDPLSAATQAVLTNISQVLLVDDVLSGILVLGGLLLLQWRIGVAALSGSVIAAILGWSAVVLDIGGQQEGTALQDGLLGYSAVLTTVAVSVVFEQPGWRTFLVAGIAAATTVPLALLLAATSVPVFTWPYVAATWAALAYLRRSGSSRVENRLSADKGRLE